MRFAAGVLLAFTIGLGPVVADSPCGLRKGLFEEKTRLEGKMMRPEGRRDQLPSDSLWQQMRAVNDAYARFAVAAALAFKKDRPALQSCCSEAGNDPIALLFCRLLTYLHDGRKDKAGFLGSFPRTKRQFSAFWGLDYSILSALNGLDTALRAELNSDQAFSGVISVSGPVDTYMDELFALVKQGDEAAARAYVILMKEADGDYAEYLDWQMTSLLQKQPDVFLRQWRILRKGRWLPGEEIRDILSEQNDLERVRQEIAKLCRQGGQTCREVSALLGP